jgi:hypothetical protein
MENIRIFCNVLYNASNEIFLSGIKCIHKYVVYMDS